MSARRHFRTFGRRELRLAGILHSESGGPQRVQLANIGLGGACVEMEGNIGSGQPVTLQVTAPNLWDPLILHAKVIWVASRRVSGSRAGMRFEHEDPEALRALVELLGATRFD